MIISAGASRFVVSFEVLKQVFLYVYASIVHACLDGITIFLEVVIDKR